MIFRRLLVALTSARWFICVRVATQFTTLKDNSCKACLSLVCNFRLSTSLLIYARAIALGLPICPFKVLNAVAYIIPCEPRPLTARSALPGRCIFNFTVLTSSVKWGLS